MTPTSLAIPLTGVAFPRSEYERRQRKVIELVESAELDALLVTAHGHLEYLTGYDANGAYFRPFPLILMPGREPTYVVREFDEPAVRALSCIDEIVTYFDRYDFAPVCADVLRQFGLQNKRVGLELDCWNLAPADVSALQAQLPDMKIADATRLVPSVSIVKSDLELALMRDAMKMTDLAVRTFHSRLQEGATEIDVTLAIQSEVRKAGGDGVMVDTLVFGERTRLPHGRPARHAIGNNEPAMIEVGGIKRGYISGILRSAVLGRHDEAESLHALAVEALEASIDVMKPGVAAEAVHAASRKVIDQTGRPTLLRSRTGYQTGVPWGERGNMSLERGSKDILDIGMTFHMPTVLFGESGYVIGVSEHVLITEGGAEILSGTPYTLYHA
ncbi:Xaa-Pro peptidase family protein [Mesorhizobium sp. M0678]|uniref:M24 family metallopeptidase n=1 Tax=Mesorhizobium sp. M0678 TaxID=2956985 RepID=UPI003336A0DB